MSKRAILFAALSLGAACVPITGHAQIAVDPRDKRVAADATGAAGSYKSQPWWEPLSMCAAVFIDQPQQTDKFRTIAAAAMLRLMEDRKIKMEDAGALVIPHIKGKAGTRAEIMMSGYGRARVEKNCDDLMVQYKAL